jgi:hypothetical protein
VISTGVRSGARGRLPVVNAPTADEALRVAFTKNAIPERERFKISVQRDSAKLPGAF